MKKLLLLTIIVLAILALFWGKYADNSYLGDAPVEEVAYRASLYEINHLIPLREELPVVTRATVIQCASLGKYGYCILADGDQRLLVLCKGALPDYSSDMFLLLIPRQLGQWQHKRFVVAAMMDYRPVGDRDNRINIQLQH
ncbi:MAG: hypothetical protein GVY26_00955 [Bacteroidetes bacterium]|jgi:hypothetical protein|nr:hypothetical protein [Bacteroidota bacterium]